MGTETDTSLPYQPSDLLYKEFPWLLHHHGHDIFVPSESTTFAIHKDVQDALPQGNLQQEK
jgi:hypothetical protein